MKANQFLPSILFSSLVLAGCGGGSSSSDSSSDVTPAPTVSPTVSPTVAPTVAPTIEPSVAPSIEPTPEPTPTPVPTFALNAAVTGLVGEVTVRVNQEQLTWSEAGSFVLASRYEAGAALSAEIIQQPIGQTCNFTGLPTQQAAEDISFGLTCSYIPGSVQGRVQHYFNGEPVIGTEVNIYNNGELVRTVVTGEDGSFQALGLGLGQRFTIASEGETFARHSDIFSTSEQINDVELNINLLPVQTIIELQPNSANLVTVNGQQVLDINTAQLAREDGAELVQPITAKVTVIDPSSNVDVMPGDLVGLNPEGIPAAIESFGALTVELTDQTGAAVDLIADSTAEIRIPLAAARNFDNSPAIIPLWYFDEGLGYWVEEGEAVLTRDDDGSVYYLGNVSHFTTWNADQIFNTLFVEGCVNDQAGAPLAGTRVIADGRDYIGRSFATTDAEGRFTIPARIDSEVLIYAQSATESQTQVVSTSVDNFVLPGCIVVEPSRFSVKLSWGLSPTDLDAHFTGPNTDQVDASRFHVSFMNMNELVNDMTINLDVDDTSSFGPEIIRMPAFPYAGVYSYYVHNYSRSPDMDQLTAVAVTLDGAVTTFRIPEGEQTLYWHVFDVVHDGVNTELAPINAWVSGVDAGLVEQPIEPMMVPRSIAAPVKKYH